LVSSNLDYIKPNWAESGKSCLYVARNVSNGEDIFIETFRVSGNGGQLCTIQGKWDRFIFKFNAGSNQSIDLSPQLTTNLSLYDYTCSLSGHYSDNVINFISSNSVNSGNIHPEWFKVDFTQKIYLLLLALFFIIIFALVFFRQFYWASALTLLIGFVLLFSGILWIFAFIVIVMGVVMASIPTKFR
jgi:hypothetical protein